MPPHFAPHSLELRPLQISAGDLCPPLPKPSTNLSYTPAEKCLHYLPPSSPLAKQMTAGVIQGPPTFSHPKRQPRALPAREILSGMCIRKDGGTSSVLVFLSPGLQLSTTFSLLGTCILWLMASVKSRSQRTRFRSSPQSGHIFADALRCPGVSHRGKER